MVHCGMERETKICDECFSEYFADSSEMGKLCPNCSRFLYGYPNCEHNFENGRCKNCHWDGSTTKFIANGKKRQTS